MSAEQFKWILSASLCSYLCRYLVCRGATRNRERPSSNIHSSSIRLMQTVVLGCCFNFDTASVRSLDLTIIALLWPPQSAAPFNCTAHPFEMVPIPSIDRAWLQVDFCRGGHRYLPCWADLLKCWKWDRFITYDRRTHQLLIGFRIVSRATELMQLWTLRTFYWHQLRGEFESDRELIL